MNRAVWAVMAMAGVVLAGCKREEPPPARRADAPAPGVTLSRQDASPDATGQPASAHGAPDAVVATRPSRPGTTDDGVPATPAAQAPSPAPQADASKRPPVAMPPEAKPPVAKAAKPVPRADQDDVYGKRSKRAASHPLAKARPHQWVLYQVGDMTQRQTVVGITPTRVRIRFQTIINGRDAADSIIETDLEAEPPRAGANRPAVQAVGRRVALVAGKRVVCDVTERARLDGSITRTWHSNDVPLDGKVRVETVRKGKTTLVKQLIDFGDFWGPDHSR